MLSLSRLATGAPCGRHTDNGLGGPAPPLYPRPKINIHHTYRLLRVVETSGRCLSGHSLSCLQRGERRWRDTLVTPDKPALVSAGPAHFSCSAPLTPLPLLQGTTARRPRGDNVISLLPRLYFRTGVQAACSTGPNSRGLVQRSPPFRSRKPH